MKTATADPTPELMASRPISDTLGIARGGGLRCSAVPGLARNRPCARRAAGREETQPKRT